MRNVPGPMKNVLRSQQRTRRDAKGIHSHRHPGHEQRMAEHAGRVAAAICPCGSGQAYGVCCLGRHRCKQCGHVYLAASAEDRTCRACGSKRVLVLALREVVG